MKGVGYQPRTGCQKLKSTLMNSFERGVMGDPRLVGNSFQCDTPAKLLWQISFPLYVLIGYRLTLFRVSQLAVVSVFLC